MPDSVPLIEREQSLYALGEDCRQYGLRPLPKSTSKADDCRVRQPEGRIPDHVIASPRPSLDNVRGKQNSLLLHSGERHQRRNRRRLSQQNSRSNFSEAFQIGKRATKVDARPINEALALVSTPDGQESLHRHRIQFGAGMVNVCYAMYGTPVFKFAIVNSGDWIDKQAAKATGESVAFINKEKDEDRPDQNPATLVERAIHTQYGLMIEHTVTGLKKGFAGPSSPSERTLRWTS
jgi:hypothetical protein